MGESLYSITERYKSIEDLLADENIPQEDINNALVSVEGEIKTKGANIIAIIKNWEATAAAAKAEAQRIRNLAKVYENRIKRLKEATIYAMGAIDIKKIESERGTLTVKDNPESLIIDDLGKIPDKYKIITYDVDKALIKSDLKHGIEVLGARLSREGKNLTIR